MNLKSALTGNKVATHYGLNNGEKLSGSGVLNFTYQLFAVLACTALVLFSGTEAVSAAGLPAKALLTVVTAFGFFAGIKLLIGLANRLTARIKAGVQNRALNLLVSFVLLFAFLGVIMSWPAAFLFILSKLAPSVVTFAGWTNAFYAGFGVLCCDTILGGLTGVSLLAGKRDKLLQAAPEAPATKSDSATDSAAEPKNDSDTK